MKPEEVARRFQSRDGQRLADFIEVGLPIYRLIVRGITLAHRRIPAIEEFILRTLRIETSSPSQLARFLGLEDRVLEPCLVGLVQTGDITASDNLLKITGKGRLTIERAEIITTEERPFSLYFDALTRRMMLAPYADPFTFQEMQTKGFFEVSQSPPVRPRIRDLRIPEVNKLAKSQYQLGDVKRDLLAITSIDNIKKSFVPAVALVYKAEDEAEIQIGVAIDGKLSPEHESILTQNPSFQKFLATRASVDLEGILTEREEGHLYSLPESAELETNTAATEAAIADIQDALAESTSAKQAEELRSRLKELEAELEKLKQEAKKQPFRNIYVYDHPPLLQYALTDSQIRLLIISPWITAEVVDSAFLTKLEALLRKGVNVHIGHGIAPQTTKRPRPQDQTAKRKLELMSAQFQNFRFVRLGNTHAKVLIKDSEFAAVTSFNWLSFKGDPNRTFRDEQGVLLQKPEWVDAKYKEALTQFP